MPLLEHVGRFRWILKYSKIGTGDNKIHIINLQNKSNLKNVQNFHNLGIVVYEVCSQKKFVVNMKRLQILEND